MTLKWCEKCSIKFIPTYVIEEVHSRDEISPITKQLTNCPHCGDKLTDGRCL